MNTPIKKAMPALLFMSLVLSLGSCGSDTAAADQAKALEQEQIEQELNVLDTESEALDQELDSLDQQIDDLLNDI